MTGDSSGENPWWLIWGIHGGESGGRRQLGEGVRRKKRGLLAAEWVSVLSSSLVLSLTGQSTPQLFSRARPEIFLARQQNYWRGPWKPPGNPNFSSDGQTSSAKFIYHDGSDKHVREIEYF